MDDINYTELLRLQSNELGAITAFCPEDQVVAEYYQGDLAQTERETVERHLTNCRFCRVRIGMLGRLEESPASKRIPEDVLATAKQMARQRQVHRPARAPAWAAAAVVVIALFTVVSRHWQVISEPAATPLTSPSTQKTASQLRNMTRGAMELNVLTPAPGADIGPGSLIRWSGVPGAIHYTIFVLSMSGDVLWTKRLEGTDWVMHEDLDLAAGSD